MFGGGEVVAGGVGGEDDVVGRGSGCQAFRTGLGGVGEVFLGGLLFCSSGDTCI